MKRLEELNWREVTGKNWFEVIVLAYVMEVISKAVTWTVASFSNIQLATVRALNIMNNVRCSVIETVSNVKSWLGAHNRGYEKLQEDKLDIVSGKNEKCQVLYWRTVFLWPKMHEDCVLILVNPTRLLQMDTSLLLISYQQMLPWHRLCFP